jgi:uncharacterized protein YlxP (DUF503 family)
MTVATLRLDLRFTHCTTARDKKRQMQAIMDRLHRSFNVSVANAGTDETADRAVLVAAAVGRTRRDARQTLERVADAVAAYPRAEVLAHDFTEV